MDDALVAGKSSRFSFAVKGKIAQKPDCRLLMQMKLFEEMAQKCFAYEVLCLVIKPGLHNVYYFLSFSMWCDLRTV